MSSNESLQALMVAAEAFVQDHFNSLNEEQKQAIAMCRKQRAMAELRICPEMGTSGIRLMMVFPNHTEMEIAHAVDHELAKHNH